ncbi:MAG: glycosyltransferase family 25 protein [Neisseria sp.]|nr:glycosyltransferase family 25 protein [Neisseria sp.]
MPACYVISLNDAVKRREHIRHEFAKHRIPFSFFDAFRPSAALDEAAARHMPALADNRTLSPGEKACMMSHVSLWQKCIDDNLPYISVFEDDILLSEHAADLLCSDTWLDSRFPAREAFILRLETFLMPVNLKNSSIEGYGIFRFPLLDSVHYGTAGYLISQAAARVLLDFLLTLEPSRIEAIDELLFKQQLNRLLPCYQISPAVCVQELQLQQENSRLQSGLQAERDHNSLHNPALKRKRSLGERLLAAVCKPYRKYREAVRVTVPFLSPENKHRQ